MKEGKRRGKRTRHGVSKRKGKDNEREENEQEMEMKGEKELYMFAEEVIKGRTEKY